MNKILSVIAIACFSCMASADTSVWHGKVSSNGTPTQSIKLILGQKYKVKVSNVINLGKWRTGGHPLENDACFEFVANANLPDFPPKKLETLKSSINIDICHGKYQESHIYESSPFIAAQNGIHFWIYDVDYEDNSGDLDVEVIQVKDE